MNKERMAAFSDGLFAVVITIMVLELRAPIGTSVKSLLPLVPIFLSYLLSFAYGAIFWINHHHMLAAAKKISSGVLWANLNFLFWLSLMPFFTAWVDENHLAPVPVAAYGVLLLMTFGSYRVLELLLIRIHDTDALISRVLRHGRREKLTIMAMLGAILLSFVHPFISMGIYIAIAAVWVMPNRALDKALSADMAHENKDI